MTRADEQERHFNRLIAGCVHRDLTVAAWAISEDWIDVGTPADLARAKGQV